MNFRQTFRAATENVQHPPLTVSQIVLDVVWRDETFGMNRTTMLPARSSNCGSGGARRNAERDDLLRAAAPAFDQPAVGGGCLENLLFILFRRRGIFPRRLERWSGKRRTVSPELIGPCERTRYQEQHSRHERPVKAVRVIVNPNVEDHQKFHDHGACQETRTRSLQSSLECGCNCVSHRERKGQHREDLRKWKVHLGYRSRLGTVFRSPCNFTVSMF